MQKKEYSIEIGGKSLIAEFNDLADQSNGSVIVKYGNTAVLATAVMSKEEKNIGFFPLTVDYEERFYAGGRILGSRFVRREGRPSDEAILSGRIVDRTIRPLFDQRLRNDVQVVITVLSLDQDDPDVISVIAGSLALGVSDIPWNGPVGAVRIGRLIGNSELKINPTYPERNGGVDLDIIACGKDGNINMIEVGGNEISEEVISSGLNEAIKEIEKLQKFQEKIISEIGKKKRDIKFKEMPENIPSLFNEYISPNLKKFVFSGPGKEGISKINEDWSKITKDKIAEEDLSFVQNYFDEQVNDLIHKEAIDNNTRPDGRGMDEIRPLFAKAGGISSILHGTGIFYRGGTHVLSVLTLGGPGDSQVIDGMESSTEKHFMHHYNFPPFSVGETGRMGGTNRRMIGHGALAEKALVPVIPSKEKFPYTIRLVSEAFASNGSTSMGSVCGSTLALMDGGVPIKKPVAGIASGLMYESPERYKILTDIQGPEDHHGDMDFKVAGTRDGITAIQMDVKVSGIPLKIISEALEKAKQARLKILDVIEKEISEPRKSISTNAPEILSTKINPDKIGLVIGTGGKNIKEIKERTGAEIDIEDSGLIFFTGKNGSAGLAKKIVEDMTHEYKKGEEFTGEVVKIMDFGAFVKVGYDAEGLVHISELAPWRVERVSDLVSNGDKVPVVVKEIDEKGRINLSIKMTNPNFFDSKKPAQNK